MIGIERGITGTIQRHAGKDEEEGVCHKRRGRFGKAELLLEEPLVEGLGGVIGNGEAAGYSDDVLGACSPEWLVDFSAEELVEDSVVHLLGWMLLRDA